MNISESIFLMLTMFIIITQALHAWYVFQSFSKLPKIIKEVQAVLFCSILSLAVFGFVIAGKTWLAVIATVIEIVINIYYYTMDYWENGVDKQAIRGKSRRISLFWRTHWIKIFVAIIIPAFIFICSEQLKGVSWVKM